MLTKSEVYAANYPPKGKEDIMDFSLTAKQLQIQNLAKDVAQKELAPKAAEVDRTSTFPRDGLKKLAEVGLQHRLPLPP